MLKLLWAMVVVQVCVLVSCTKQANNTSTKQVAEPIVQTYPYIDTITGVVNLYEHSCTGDLTTPERYDDTMFAIHLSPTSTVALFLHIPDTLALFLRDTLKGSWPTAKPEPFVSYTDTLLLPGVLSPDTFRIYLDTIFIAYLDRTRIITRVQYSRQYSKSGSGWGYVQFFGLR